MTLTMAIVTASCGEDAADEASATSDPLAVESAETTAPAAGEDVADVPDDYPLPVPPGGRVNSALVGDEGSNVVLIYPMEMVDDLVATYDDFFAALDGETQVAPLTDGLGSWYHDGEGYSVVINAQNADIQVTLQTGASG